MSNRKRQQGSRDGGPDPKRSVPARTLYTCTYTTEWISPIFDPKKVLLRCVFFFNYDK
jgi:hypothetical protein